MYCLNLSAEKSVSVRAVNLAQEVVKDMVACFRSAVVQSGSGLLADCIEKSDDARVSKSQLAQMSTTQFIERHTSVVCFRSLLRFVLEALTQMTS